MGDFKQMQVISLSHQVISSSRHSSHQVSTSHQVIKSSSHLIKSSFVINLSRLLHLTMQTKRNSFAQFVLVQNPLWPIYDCTESLMTNLCLYNPLWPTSAIFCLPLLLLPSASPMANLCFLLPADWAAIQPWLLFPCCLSHTQWLQAI